ncbi:hypothetical protein [Dinghuibacter silviterrae]|nr:hypothetical protein [Dinghuibacter silviterrae]
MGQVEVQGTVYDQTQSATIRDVDVHSSSGVSAVTDSLGHYRIKVREHDTLYFSYLNKRTPDFPVQYMQDPSHFDIAMGVVAEYLPDVYVRPNSYHLDSMENREEYQDIFNYQGANYVNNMAERGRGMGIGLNLDAFLGGAHQIDKSRQSAQRYMEENERQKYIDHRFSKTIVKRITGLQPPLLDTFMHAYRPSYDYLQATQSDWELYMDIQRWGEAFKEDHPAWKDTTGTK